MKHNVLLHGSSNSYCNVVNALPSEKEVQQDFGPKALLPMQWAPTSHTKENALVFWDCGSNICLIRRQYAEDTGLKGQRVTQSIATTGRAAEEWETQVYRIELVDKQGIKYPILAFEMETITGDQEPTEVAAALELLPAVPDMISIFRPSGPVDILVGIKYASLLLWLVDRKKHTCKDPRLGLFD